MYNKLDTNLAEVAKIEIVQSHFENHLPWYVKFTNEKTIILTL